MCTFSLGEGLMVVVVVGLKGSVETSKLVRRVLVGVSSSFGKRIVANFEMVSVGKFAPFTNNVCMKQAKNMNLNK